MYVFSRVLPAGGSELSHQGEDRVSDDFGFVAQAVEIQLRFLHSLGYQGSDLGGDYVALRLGSGEGGFSVDAAVDVGFIVEYLVVLKRLVMNSSNALVADV